MQRSMVDEIMRIGGDPSDEVWRWLCTRGPHGERFSWGQTRDNPAGYIGIVHLKRVIDERSVVDAMFRERACEAAFRALSSSTPDLVRRGIQVLAVVAGAPEQSTIKTFTSSPDADIAADAKACMFYLKRRNV
jgi:hypothetical protein